MAQTLDIEKAVRTLGPALEEFRVDPARARARQVFGSWLVLTAAVLLVGAILLGLAQASGTLALFLILAVFLGAIGLPLGCWLVAFSVRQQRTRFLIFERGLAFERPQRVECLRWDEIATVRMNSRPWGEGAIYSCCLQLSDGRQLAFAKHSSLFPGMAHLCDRIQLELTSRQFPPALEAFDEGRDLHFGSITINRLGIRKGKQLLRWEAIDEVQLHNGAISISHYPLDSQAISVRSEDGARNTVSERDDLQLLNWPDATPDTVPNIFVLLTLIRQIAPRKQPRSRHSN